MHVVRGELNDRLTISISGINPGLMFDLFTVLAEQLEWQPGMVDPAFKGSLTFAGTSTDLRAGDKGSGRAAIHGFSAWTRIFGFDADTVPNTDPPVTRVPPTNTFHVGFWFNNPEGTRCPADLIRQSRHHSMANTKSLSAGDDIHASAAGKSRPALHIADRCDRGRERERPHKAALYPETRPTRFPGAGGWEHGVQRPAAPRDSGPRRACLVFACRLTRAAPSAFRQSWP